MTAAPERIADRVTIAVLVMTEDHEMIVVPAISADLATIVVPEMNVDPEMIADPEMTAVLAISEVQGTNPVAGPVPATAAACPAVGMTGGADVMTTDHVDRHVTNPSGAAATERHALSHLLVKIGDAIGMSRGGDDGWRRRDDDGPRGPPRDEPKWRGGDREARAEPPSREDWGRNRDEPRGGRGGEDGWRRGGEARGDQGSEWRGRGGDAGPPRGR